MSSNENDGRARGGGLDGRGLQHRVAKWSAGPLSKAVLVGVLILLMLIPLDLVQGVIQDREGRYRSVVREIGLLWGGAQHLRGPILAVPFESAPWKDDEKARPRRNVIYILPDHYRVSSVLEPDLRRRGLFETVVYRADLGLEGDFVLPDVEDWGRDVARVLWAETRLILGVKDPRGIAGGTLLDWNGRKLAFEPGTPAKLLRGLRGGILEASLSVPLPGMGPGMGKPAGSAPPSKRFPFSLSLRLNGSERFELLPMGRESQISLASPWPSPSFEGAYLPARREVGESGFKADWALSYFGRSYPQHWLATEGTEDLAEAWNRSAFGVRLFRPVGAYHQAERSAKYGVLFLIYTFGALFLFELLGRLPLHIVHYGLVGLSLSLFYLLLLSLAEHLGFAPAYLIAAAAVVAQIGLYTWGAVGSRWRSASFTALLAALYAALYGLMQLETYALLIGSICLFLLLALVMAVARRIDWYALDRSEADAPAA